MQAWSINVPAGPGTGGLVKDALVVTRSGTPDPLRDHPAYWNVVSYKAPVLLLEKIQPFFCAASVAPATVPGPGSVNVFTGPCVKPDGGGPAALQGISDLIVDNGVPAVDLFHCIFKTDIGGAGNVKNAAVCFDNTGALGTGAAAEPINDLPGEGVDGDSGGVGPPPPPPYGVAPPAKGTGNYNGSDIVTTTCFPDVGTSTNIIAVTTVPGALAQLTAQGFLTGSVLIYVDQTNAACDALTPAGAAPAPLSLSIYPAIDQAPCPAGNCVQAPYRTGGDTDFDNDGCTDEQELDEAKAADASKCGDDPWNPHDLVGGTDVSGSYSLTAVALRQDVGAGGLYYDCNADINQSGKALTARLLCYIDSASFTVNPQAAGGNITCPPANANLCGDGVSGAPPPGTTVGTYPTNPRLLADVDDKHTVLTGTLDNAQNVIKLAGCFEDRDGEGNLGDVYVRAEVNAHSGHGVTNLWSGLSNGLTNAQCIAGTPPGTGSVIPVHITRQAAKATPPAGRDTDLDGCPNKRELSDTAGQGGLRDPSNHYDYMNATKDGLNRVDDILAVVNQYFIDDPVGNPDMKSQTDRTAISGGNAWNLGPPNGQQRVDDILASVKQYFHDC